MATYKCSRKGDHTVKIAEEKDVFSWKTLWDANKSLQSKKNRSNPLVLFTGDKTWSGKPDVLKIPKPKAKPKNQNVDTNTVFSVPTPAKLCLRIRILTGTFTPIKDAEFELAVDGNKLKGKTDAEGRLKIDGADPEIGNKTLTATLSIRITPEDAGAPKKGKNDKSLEGAVPITWKLQIGKLDPIMEKAPRKYCISGVQQRLNNLGINSGPVDGIRGSNTIAAVETFQSLFKLKVDGKPGQGETQPKLKEVFDEGKFTGPPPGEVNIKHPVSEKKKLKTEEKDIGHVAPDFVDASKPFINALVVRPQYRISLDLGDIEELFLHNPETDRGRMERMQVAGLFYFPMNHKMAWDTSKTDPGDEAYFKAWHYYTHELGGDQNALVQKVRDFIIDGAKLPPPGPEGNNKPDKKHYAKLRIPGGYTYIDSSGKFKPNHDPKYPLNMETDNQAIAEQMVRTDNPLVGVIPLKAKVEQRYGESGEWKPAKDVSVYFQLLKPYDLPDFDASSSPAEQINRPPLRASDMQTDTNTGKGPDKLDKAVSSGLPDDDPQKLNCHKDHGGHGGEPILDHVFEKDVNLAKYGDAADNKPRPGFYAAHTGDRADVVKPPFLNVPVAAAADGDKHKHAVTAKTNEAGYAGVIFKPGKAGDRYRLRVYIGPSSLPSDGTAMDAVKVETGTMVVWRNVRVSKVANLPSTQVASEIQTQIVEQTKDFIGKLIHHLTTETQDTLFFDTGFTNNQKQHVGYSSVDLSETGDSSCAYDGFFKQMARAYYEVELDPGADTSVALSDTDWRAALRAAVTFAKANNVAGTQQIDVDKLVIQDANKVTANNSFVLIPLRTPKVYNAMLPSGSPYRIALNGSGQLTKKDDLDTWFDQCLLYPFAHHLASKGYLPGLTMLQIPTISTWHYIGLLSDYAIGLGFRTCVMNAGKDKYPYSALQKNTNAPHRGPYTLKRPGTTNDLDDFGYSALMAHEWGHCMFREHATPNPIPNGQTYTAYFKERHDPEANGYCVMTYLPQEGQFCAKCLYGLRGWTKVDELP